MNKIFLKKLLIWLFFSLNLIFAFIIGLTIPSMESESRFVLGIVIIPLLIILNYVLLDRFHYILKHSGEGKEQSNDGFEEQGAKT